MATPWEQALAAEYAKFGRTPTAADIDWWSKNENPEALRNALAADAAKVTTPTKTYGLKDIAGKYNAQGQPMTAADADFWTNYLTQSGNDWNQTSAAMDNAFIYDRAKATPVQQPLQQPIEQQNNQFMDILGQMMQGFGQQQKSYQQSMTSLIDAWANMAKPQTPTAPVTDPAASPYGAGSGVSGTKDGIGQASAVYNPMGQNGLNFGWAANNPFGATF